MPTINKPKKKRNYQKTGISKDINKIYASKNWVNLRESYRMEHQLCEECLKNGIVKKASEIHHIKPISFGTDYLDMCDIAYNPDNLIALCKECHIEAHKKLGKWTKK